MAADIPFQVYTPVRIFRKAGVPEHKQWRIGGVVSTELPDAEKETVLQRGLNFKPFLRSGWFNDNHSKGTTDVLGYPETVAKFAKGATLPDGTKAPANCSWVEGYLIPKWHKAQQIWDLAKALETTDRRLRFSVEGKVDKRQGPNGKIVAEATVRNVAITNAPIGEDTRMEILAKSLAKLERGEELGKALTVGLSPTPGTPLYGQPMTGAGAGQVLGQESQESDLHVVREPKLGKKTKRRGVEKSLSHTEALTWVENACPGVSRATAERVVRLARGIHTIRRQG